MSLHIRFPNDDKGLEFNDPLNLTAGIVNVMCLKQDRLHPEEYTFDSR